MRSFYSVKSTRHGSNAPRNATMRSAPRPSEDGSGSGAGGVTATKAHLSHQQFLIGLLATTSTSTRSIQASAAASFRGPESFQMPSKEKDGGKSNFFRDTKTSSTQPPKKSGAAKKKSSPTSLPASLEAALIDEVLLLITLLPPQVREKLENDPRLGTLVEVVMDLGRPPLARFPSGDVKLSPDAVTEADIQYAVDACGDFGGDNRAGIDKTLHRISCIRNRAGKVVGLTCRAGRAIQGSAAMVADLATAGKSILLLGRPGVGKTTAIREISRLLADDCYKRVVIVDTSNEIGGDGDVPHPGVGGARRMQVSHPEQQHRVMIEAVENHMPEVIVIDEIGTEAEALAARTIAQRGVQLVATAHGNELENVMKNPSLNDLVGGITSVTLGDEEAKRRGVQKSILERGSPPTFDVAIEMESRDRWKVHLDVAYAVDQVLLGGEAGAEVRERDSEGQVWAWPEDVSTSSSDDEDEFSNGSGGTLSGNISGKNGTSASSTTGILPPKQKKRGANGGGQRRLELETQPFPEAALAAARGGFAMGSAALALQQQQQAASAENNDSDDDDGMDTIKGHKLKSNNKNAIAHPASAAALRVYLYGVDSDSVLSVAEALKLRSSIDIASQIQDADAILATRGKMKASTWIKAAAQQAGVPLFTVRTAAVEHVVKGVRTLLGVDPTPGGMFSPGSGEGPAMADPRVASSRNLRAETSIALVKGSAPSAATVKSGLDEAREAIESIVLKQNQPVELLPRHEMVVERQVALARGYGLKTEVAGTAAAGGRRVRVMPMDWEEKVPETREQVQPTTAKKEFW
jgi:stage III sporulation protein SpoIIIAA